ncbi:MAG: tetratricopeptide repeat protein, partial [Longimicrobiales bacterium]
LRAVRWDVESEADADGLPRTDRPRRRKLAAFGFLAAVAIVAFAALVVATGGRDEAPAAAVPAADRPRLAVLPFTGSPTDTSDAYLALALAGELIAGLGRFDGLIVRPLDASRALGERTTEPRAAAEALAVDYLLAGAWNRADDSLRIDLELIDGATGRAQALEPIAVHFDRVSGLRRIVPPRIASRLGVASMAGYARAEAAAGADPTAYHLYLRSQASPHTTPDGNRYARDLLLRSVALDSTYAPSQAALGCRSFALANLGFTPERAAMFREAERAFERARAIDPDQFLALTCGSLLYLETGRIERALEPLRHALIAYPHNADVLISLGHVYRQGGLLELGLTAFERAETLDPSNLRLTSAGLGYLYAGRGEKALALFDQDPTAPPSLLFKGLTLLDMGELERVRELLAAAAAAPGWGPIGRVAAGYIAWLDGDTARGLGVVGELERRAGAGGVSGEELYHYARLGAGFGDLDAAVRLFGRAVERGFLPVPYFARDPFLEPLRADQRFRAALERARARRDAFRALVSTDDPLVELSRNPRSSRPPSR